MKLAADINSIFGTIAPPPGTPGGASSDPVAAISKVLSVGLQLVLIVAAILLLVYLLWGALDWLVSGGEKEKLVKAQNKITNAVIGMLMVVAAFTLFTVVTGTILGNKIIENTGDGWKLIIPTIAP